MMTITGDLYNSLYEAVENGQSVSAERIAVALNSSDAFEQWIGCKAAGCSSSEQWIEKLFELASRSESNSNPDVGAIAVWALAKIDGPVVLDRMRQMARDPDWRVRRIAADLIGELRADHAGLLPDLIKDERLEVVSWACLAAAKIGRASTQTLKHELLRTNDEKRALYLIDALFKIDSDSAKKLVENAIKHWPPAKYALACTRFR